MQYTINKTYTETVAVGTTYKKFSTSLTKTIDVKNADELIKESEKLFEQAKWLTEKDAKKTLGR